MARKPNELLKLYLLEVAPKYTVKELVPMVNKKFKEHYEEQELRKYLFRNRISYKYECEKRANNNANNCPIGTEYVKPGGIVIVKIANNKWVDKQRYIYETYHNVKLKNDEFVIFLDSNKDNFSIDNLKVIPRRQAGVIGANGLKSDIKEITELGINIATLKVAIKDKMECLGNDKRDKRIRTK